MDAEEPAADEEEEEPEPSPQPQATPKPAAASLREPERQLSKKELKKKELEDMDAVLAELGLSVPTESERAEQQAAGAPEGGVSKTALKKLKKQQQAAIAEAKPVQEEAADDELPPDDDTPLVDLEEAKRRIAAARGAKPKPKLSAAQQTAIAEAKARGAKKGSDRSNYNQTPA